MVSTIESGIDGIGSFRIRTKSMYVLFLDILCLVAHIVRAVFLVEVQFLRLVDILHASLQFLLYYEQLVDCLKRINLMHANARASLV